MRFMIIVKATASSEAGVMPDEGVLSRMASYHEALVGAGALLDAARLQPSALAWRIRHEGEARARIDGPFTDTAALIAAYTLIQVNSREEAMAWARRFPNPAGDGKPAEIEVRPLYALGDFAPSAALDRFRATGAGE